MYRDLILGYMERQMGREHYQSALQIYTPDDKIRCPSDGSGTDRAIEKAFIPPEGLCLRNWRRYKRVIKIRR